MNGRREAFTSCATIIYNDIILSPYIEYLEDADLNLPHSGEERLNPDIADGKSIGRNYAYGSLEYNLVVLFYFFKFI